MTVLAWLLFFACTYLLAGYVWNAWRATCFFAELPLLIKEGKVDDLVAMAQASDASAFFLIVGNMLAWPSTICVRPDEAPPDEMEDRSRLDDIIRRLN